jgi:hypothetical protein
MVRLYVPAAVTVVLIAAFTALEAKFSDRFNSSAVTAEEFDAQFKGLPKEVGPWVGTDKPVDDKTLQVAGAVNYVSRTYRNTQNGTVVDLWLIVGHSRDIVRHTPDICYPAHGMGQDDPTPLKQPIEIPGEPVATFYTARFRTEVDLTGIAGPKNQRVFWAWNPNTKDEYQWDAPDSARLHYGNNPKLYKMYFSAMMKDHDEPMADNAALAFAKVMLPHINETLFPDKYKATAEENSATPPDAGASAAVPVAAQPLNEPAAGGEAPVAPPANPAASPTTAIPAGSAPAAPPAEATNPAAAAK